MASDSNRNLVRLFVSRENLSRGETHALTEGQLHYLRNVMRLEEGAPVRVFNGRNGEWRGELVELSKKKAIVSFVEKIREQIAGSDVWVLASPVKKEAFDIMVEKSAELGASVFQPVLCDHTVVHRVNDERLTALAIEAAEQCERLDLMQVNPALGLKDALASWPSERKLMFCVERSDAPGIASALQSVAGRPVGVLVGPEGGFSAGEIEYISRQPFVMPVSLGPRILKAETALIAALACVQAFASP